MGWRFFVGWSLCLLVACSESTQPRLLYVEAIDMPEARTAFEDFRAAFRASPIARPDIRLHICGTREMSLLVNCVEAATAQHAPALIVAPSGLVAEAAITARVDRPVVFSVNVDPVRQGLVPSLLRPGGNATGVSWVLDLEDKAVDLVASLSSSRHRVAVLVDDGWIDENGARFEALREQWAVRGVELLSVVVRAPLRQEAVVDSLRRRSATAVIVPLSLASYTDPDLLSRAATSARLPTVFVSCTPSAERSLMIIHADVSKVLDRHRTLVERVLAGADPGTVSVERPASVRVTVDLGVAEALGLKIPKSVLAQADVVHR
jgi:putative ABC transport system substrate-binding protein